MHVLFFFLKGGYMHVLVLCCMHKRENIKSF